MQIYQLITLIIVLTAAFGYINFRFIRLPATIGIMLMAIVASLIIFLLGEYHPGFFYQVTELVEDIDFNTVLMKIMLGFLLFAGAIHINLKDLKQAMLPVAIFSTVGVLISTFIVGGLAWWITGWFGYRIDFIYCLLFGALISPTDPIAVLGILRQAHIAPSLEIKITGESLFNDGVAVVVFLTIYEIIHMGAGNVTVGQVSWLFIKEAGGGIAYGAALGYLGFFILRSIDQYTIELLVTIAIVMGGYLVADYLHVSGPLAMVVAGIVTGNKILEEGTSDESRDHIEKFWGMMDEVLNAVLFLLIGFEMLIIPFSSTVVWLGLVMIVVVLLARLISVAVPVFFLRFKKTFEKNAITILTWGGLRGGISVALALSLSHAEQKEVFVPVTYVIVVFSILVQGLTIGRLAKRLSAK